MVGGLAPQRPEQLHRLDTRGTRFYDDEVDNLGDRAAGASLGAGGDVARQGPDAPMISQTAEYAIRALAYIAAHGRERRVLAREISHELKVPANYLSKILHHLARSRILASARGASGGFQLALDPETVTLLDVVNLFDGTATRRECFLGQAVCSDEDPCHVHHRWKPVITSYLEFLSQTSLAEMSRRRPGTPIQP